MISARDMVKISLNLVVVYVVGGVLLAAVYVNTSPIIYRNSIKEKKAALEKIMPEANRIEKLGDWTIHEKQAEYFIAKKDSQVCGYLIESYGKGYSGLIHVLLATDTAGKIIRISILSHAETPGLGDEIETGWFKKQFIGKTGAQMKVIKGPTQENVQAISGATISSRAVTEDAVKTALENFATGKNDKK
jgi:Na+-translocating ferredoxin:NAD+ oxidoreductase subunit G